MCSRTSIDSISGVPVTVVSETPTSTLSVHHSRTNVSEPLLLQSIQKSIEQNTSINKNNNESVTIHNKLGTINGVYIPCLLNILGIVLFERLSWGIGHVGIFFVIIIYLISEIAAILTVLSLSAIITNGAMKGGGSYYMISRTLGPEFGGSVGILFYCAYCVNIAFCCTGCAEEIIKTWYNDERNVDEYWTLNLIFSSSILFICLCISLLGASCFTKINIFLFLTTFSAITLSIFAGFFRDEFILPDYADNTEYIHQNWNWSQFKENFVNDCHVK